MRKAIVEKEGKKTHEEINKHRIAILFSDKQKQRTDRKKKHQQRKHPISYTGDKLSKLVYEVSNLHKEEIAIIKNH